MRARLPKLLFFALLCAAPVLGAALLFTRYGAWWPLVPYGLASVVSVAQYRSDKARASHSQRRIPERTLHLVELFGGWPGALWAQQLYRHKTRKVAYQVVFWLVVVLHEAAWIAWLVLSGAVSNACL